MEIIQCSYCKKPFQSYGSKTCLECTGYIDECMRKIRDYLYEHPNSGVEIVSYETRVPVKLIMFLLKEGRLLLVDNEFALGILICESCKRPIKSGRLCDECRQSLAITMNEKIGGVKIKPDDDKDVKSAKIES